MQLEHQVCTLEQSKKLKELGLFQDSALFSWCGNESHAANNKPWVWISQTIPVNNQMEEMRQDIPSAKPFAAAFTVGELGRMLTFPDKYYKTSPIKLSFKTPADKWSLDLNVETENEEEILFEHEAHARAALLIYFIENDIHTAEYFNTRLSA
jgi:hypothetical protein